MRLIFCALWCVGCGTSSEIAITFEGVVGAEPVQCGATYEGVGTSESALRLLDLRFFVHDVRLVTDEGGELPLALTQDGEWQYEDVALVDLETGCFRGDERVNRTVRGTIDEPGAALRGLRFRLGVPFELNHLNFATAPPPLDQHGLWWSWNQGYTFLRVQAESTGQPDGFFVLLASTGCEGDGAGQITSCIQRNVIDVEIPAFDPAADVVTIDLGALFAGSDIDLDQGGERGCMSGFDDGDCRPIFHALGLPFLGEPAPGPQRVFD